MFLNNQYNLLFLRFSRKEIMMMRRYKAEIVGHENQTNGKVAYKLQVEDELTKRKKTVLLRYSQFKDIHDEIQQIVSKLKLHINLPEFPGRRFFGSTNKSQEAVLERQKGLQNYVNELLQIEKLTSLEMMKKYYVPDQNQTSGYGGQNKEANIQISIDRYSLVDDAVIYYVGLRDLNTREEWVYKARYRQLKNLHEALVEAKIKNLPVFPKKNLFGKTNENPDQIQKRREQLEKYFNQIFNVKEIIRSEPIRFFIQQSRKQAQKEKDFEVMRKKNSN